MQLEPWPSPSLDDAAKGELWFGELLFVSPSQCSNAIDSLDIGSGHFASKLSEEQRAMLALVEAIEAFASSKITSSIVLQSLLPCLLLV